MHRGALVLIPHDHGGRVRMFFFFGWPTGITSITTIVAAESWMTFVVPTMIHSITVSIRSSSSSTVTIVCSSRIGAITIVVLGADWGLPVPYLLDQPPFARISYFFAQRVRYKKKREVYNNIKI